MSLIQMDFETKSRVDLPKHGAVKYFSDYYADIIFLWYKIEQEEPGIWHPGDPLPDFMKDPSEHTFWAFNAIFEFRAWNMLGVVKHNFGVLPLENLIDVMAVCGRFAYPQNLDRAGEVLNLKMQKDKHGKALIKKICCPPFNYTHQEFYDFMQYGKRDVESMYEMTYALPATRLSDREQAVWEVTQRINLRGLPIDIKAVEQILKVTEAYKLEQNTLLPDLTGGSVTKATQAKRIKNWLNHNGIPIPNLQAGTVEKYLAKKDLPSDAKLLLILRQELGKSSTAKYQKLLDQTHNGRLYDNLRYAGANTLRWAGLGFQLHNLPRSKVKDAQPIIDKFYDLSIIEDNPINAAKSIIRGMICAPDGKLLLFIDYSSIENRLLAWTAEDEVKIQRFRDGFDEYKDMASHMFLVPYDKVNDEQRSFGKMLVLGCGYGLGHVGFAENAAGWGVSISLVEANNAVKAYRKSYNKVVRLWYDCKDAAINAILHPGHEFIVNKLVFKVIRDKNGQPWLSNMLPSGRAIYYNDPQIGEGKFGAEPNSMGINPYSKKWGRHKIIPGRFVENVVQALARDVLADAKLALYDQGYDLIGSVHDEVIIEVNDDIDKNKTLDEVELVMCTSSPWANDLPLKAEGVVEKRYRKM